MTSPREYFISAEPTTTCGLHAARHSLWHMPCDVSMVETSCTGGPDVVRTPATLARSDRAQSVGEGNVPAMVPGVAGRSMS
jgi:hypothetical protein